MSGFLLTLDFYDTLYLEKKQILRKVVCSTLATSRLQMWFLKGKERKQEKKDCLVYPFGTFWSCFGLVCLHVHEADVKATYLGDLRNPWYEDWWGWEVVKSKLSLKQITHSELNLWSKDFSISTIYYKNTSSAKKSCPPKQKENSLFDGTLYVSHCSFLLE